MAQDPGSSSVKMFVPLGGSSRKYVNRFNGEIVSRRQRDKIEGSLKNFSSYERKAAFNKKENPLLSAARPSRGKPSTIKSVLHVNPKALNLSSIKGRKFRDEIIKIHYLDDMPDFDRLAEDFYSFIEGLKRNPRIFSVVTALVFTANGEKDIRNLIPARRWPTVEQLGEAITLMAESYEFTGDEILNALYLHIMFDSRYMNTLLGIKSSRT